MEFYGDINSIAIDDSFPLFFLYTGISHIFFGVVIDLEKKNYTDSATNRSK